MRILVADDDKTLCENIAKILNVDLYAVDTASSGNEATDLIDYYTYDLLVLDWMMPGALGIEVCQYARGKGFDGGILILTAKDATENIIEGLDAGADDYMVKPFKMEELRARVRAILRRKNKIVEEEIIVGSLKLNKNKRTVYIDNFEVNLTKNEFLLLEYLIENKGQILTHEQVIEYVWGIDDNANTNTLAALVRLVRKKIDVEEEPSFIQSLRGLGYKLRDN
ncbi:response regulator transcription factor [Solibacillus daqui]|uniref:response regulator transcription factor n=1 Tax=Solibacillus daqui TaxID=2912187 RepID=UPI0023663A73|nr:response regulator transcription factor [Solibacillus daqui]